MCAIFGIYGEYNKKNLIKLSEIQKLRGPDHTGFYLSKKQNISLGMNRLAVIDIKQGNQPIFSENKEIIGFFNGCIFNFKEIKKYLVTKKINFKTNSDTEVLVNSFSFWGEKCFNYFDGMWAVSLFDFKKKELILSRDYLGQKPLYYSKLKKNKLIYSSQINGITEYIKKPVLEKKNVKLYYQLSHLPAPYTIYKKINQLMPGEILKFSQSKIKKKIFWKIENGPNYNLFFKEVKKYDLLDNFLKNLENYTYADKKTVLALSSGIDSNLLRYSLKKLKKKLSAFMIGYEDFSFDETHQVPKEINEKIIKKKLKNKDLIKTFKDLKRKIFFLNGDGSIIPTFNLFKNIKKKTNNSISGDGGDELFFGYITFKAFYLMIWFKKIFPNFLSKILFQISNNLKINTRYLNYKLKLKLFFKHFDQELSLINIFWLSDLTRKDLYYLTKLKKDHPEINKINKLFRKNNDKMRFAQLFYFKYYLPMVLEKVDQASMLNSIENRAPILSKDLINFSLNYPTKKNFSLFKNKHLIKNIFKNIIPDKFFKIKKHGFSLPKYLILKNKKLIYQILDEKILLNKEYFEKKYNDYLNSNNNEQYIWNELILNIYRQNIEIKK